MLTECYNLVRCMIKIDKISINTKIFLSCQTIEMGIFIPSFACELLNIFSYRHKQNSYSKFLYKTQQIKSDRALTSKFLSKEEAKKLLETARNRAEVVYTKRRKIPVRDYLIIELALSTGLRVMEIAKLNCGDVLSGMGFLRFWSETASVVKEDW